MIVLLCQAPGPGLLGGLDALNVSDDIDGETEEPGWSAFDTVMEGGLAYASSKSAVLRFGGGFGGGA